MFQLSGLRLCIQFLAVNLVLLLLLAPVIVLFGPFSNVKRTVVGAIMTSRHPQYITWLFSPEEIKAILPDFGSADLRQDPVQLKIRKDDTLKLVNITSGRFQGYLLEVPDPSRIKVATARDLQEKGDTVSTMALHNNAIAAINAGGFHDPEGTGTGRLPYGIIVRDGKFIVGGEITETGFRWWALPRRERWWPEKYNVKENEGKLGWRKV